MTTPTLSKNRLFAYLILDGIHVEGGELKMARNGHGLSISKIGDIYYSREDYFKALHWYQLGAIEGYAYSQYKLGIMCSDGKGVRVDYKLAFEWFLKAHNNGSPVATTCMGFMYDFGQGVPQDNELAFKWYMEAAVRGYNLAQYNVGACYQYGEGVKADIHHALEWYQKSAEQGFSNAKYVVLMIKKEIDRHEHFQIGINQRKKQKVEQIQLDPGLQEAQKVVKMELDSNNNGMYLSLKDTVQW